MVTRIFNWFRGLFVQDRYEAAHWSADRGWLPTTIQSARFDASKASRETLVAKSRYWERNSDLQNRLADLFECYTSGMICSPASSSPEWNKAAQKWFDGWCQFPDVATMQTFATLQGLMSRGWFIDGEAFVILTNGESGRPRLQLIESHLVATPPGMESQEGVSLYEGIKLDPVGRPIGYYVATENGKGERTYRLIPAASVIHIFEPGRPGQLRGLPFCYSVLNLLQDLDELQGFTMLAAKELSSVTHVIKNAAGELSGETLKRQRFTQSTQTGAGVAVTEDRAAIYQSKFGGRTVVLKTGDEYQQVASNVPSVVTQDYWRLLQERICTGQGIPLVIALPDSMQGTVYRGALDMANAFFRSRSEVIAAAVRRIYAYVMGWAIKYEPSLKGAPEDWATVSIRPPRAVNVDVGRNSAAMLAELAAGATNWELIYAPLGLDWRDCFRRLAEQQAFAKELGLELQIGSKPAEPADPSEPDADEEPAPPKKKEDK